jgi:hypothetical protein
MFLRNIGILLQDKTTGVTTHKIAILSNNPMIRTTYCYSQQTVLLGDTRVQHKPSSLFCDATAKKCDSASF